MKLIDRGIDFSGGIWGAGALRQILLFVGVITVVLSSLPACIGTNREPAAEVSGSSGSLNDSQNIAEPPTNPEEPEPGDEPDEPGTEPPPSPAAELNLIIDGPTELETENCKAYTFWVEENGVKIAAPEEVTVYPEVNQPLGAFYSDPACEFASTQDQIYEENQQGALYFKALGEGIVNISLANNSMNLASSPLAVTISDQDSGSGGDPGTDPGTDPEPEPEVKPVALNWIVPEPGTAQEEDCFVVSLEIEGSDGLPYATTAPFDVVILADPGQLVAHAEGSACDSPILKTTFELGVPKVSFKFKAISDGIAPVAAHLDPSLPLVITTIDIAEKDSPPPPAPAPENLDYGVNSIELLKGQVLQNLVPTWEGTVTSFTSIPDLSTYGLNLSVVSGVISGTATKATLDQNIKIYAQGPSGETYDEITLKILSGTPVLSYTNENASYTVGQSISSNLPTFSDTELGPISVEVSQYSVSPSLPQGLNLNSSTGAINGTPSVEGNSVHTMTADTAYGNIQKQISIDIASDGEPPAPPKHLIYPPANYLNAQVGDSINLVPTWSGVVDTFSVSPALPTGLGIDSKTGVISGVPTEDTGEQKIHTVTATGPSGSDQVNVKVTIYKKIFYSPGSTYYFKGNPKIEPQLLGNQQYLLFFISPDIEADTGLKFDPVTGNITGTPKHETNGAIEYSVTSALGFQHTKISIDVKPHPISYAGYLEKVEAQLGSIIDPVGPTVTMDPGTVVTYSAPELEQETGLSINPFTGVITGTAQPLTATKYYPVTLTSDQGAIKHTHVSVKIYEDVIQDISYPDPMVFKAGLKDEYTPTIQGVAIGFSVDPPLPNGMWIDDGVIKEYALTTPVDQEFTVTAHNGSDKAQTVVKIESEGGLQYPSEDVTILAGLPVDITLEHTLFGEGVEYSISPNLTYGLSFNTITGRITGTVADPKEMQEYTISSGQYETKLRITIENEPVSFANWQYETFFADVPFESAAIESDGSNLFYEALDPLPSGITISETRGVLMGKTAETGSFAATIRVSNDVSSHEIEISFDIEEGQIQRHFFSAGYEYEYQTDSLHYLNYDAKKDYFRVGHQNDLQIEFNSDYNDFPVEESLVYSLKGDRRAVVVGNDKDESFGYEIVLQELVDGQWKYYGIVHNTSQTTWWTVFESPMVFDHAGNLVIAEKTKSYSGSQTSRIQLYDWATKQKTEITLSGSYFHSKTKFIIRTTAEGKPLLFCVRCGNDTLAIIDLDQRKHLTTIILSEYVSTGMVSHFGDFVYHLDTFDDLMYIYAVNQETGLLTLQNTQPIEGFSSVQSSLSGDGRALFLHGNVSGGTPYNQIRVYEINQSTGALTLRNTYDNVASQIVSDPKGEKIWLFRSNDLIAYDFVGFDLTNPTEMDRPLGDYRGSSYGSPMQYRAKNVYVASKDSQELRDFTFDDSGEIPTLAETSVTALPNNPNEIVWSNHHEKLYIAYEESETIETYLFDALSGLPSLYSGSSLVGKTLSLFAHPFTGLLFRGTDKVDEELESIKNSKYASQGYEISASNSWNLDGTNPAHLAASHAGQNLFVVEKDIDQLTKYTLYYSFKDEEMYVLNGDKVTTGDAPSAVAIHPRGWVYTSISNEDKVSVYNAGLDLKSEQTVGSKPRRVRVDAANDCLFVMNRLGNSVSAFKINPDNGNLTDKGVYPVGDNPMEMAVEAQRLVTANSGSNTVSYYRVKNTCMLDNYAELPAGDKPRSVVIRSEFEEIE